MKAVPSGYGISYVSSFILFISLKSNASDEPTHLDQQRLLSIAFDNVIVKGNTVDSRYLDFAYLE